MLGKRLLVVIGATAAIAGSTAGSAFAGPPERVGEDAFVCPVLNLPGEAVENGGQGELFNELGDSGQYSFGQGNAGNPDTFNGNVPLHATNGEGEGTPGVDHVGPGDPGYTAIWSGN
jgi:hypothetical protein